jgi:type I restriction enzyme S subunit
LNLVNIEDLNEHSLPAGWTWTTIGDVVKKMSNGLTRRQNKEKAGLPVTRIETISNGFVDLERVRYLPNLPKDVIEKYKLQKGDVLFSHINSDFHLGKTALFDIDGVNVIHGMNLLLLRADPRIILPRYLHYLCNYYRYSGLFVSIAQHAVNQSSINQTKLKKVPIPLPSIPVQRRIVEKIEELTTQLEAGTRDLRRAKTDLARYKASVLKAACEGRLVPTEAELARVEGRDYESGEELLRRILDERKKKWEEEQRAKGKDPSKMNYREPEAPNTEGLPELPEGWVWARVGQISHTIQYGTSEKANLDPSGIPVLRMGNIQDGNIDFGNLKYLSHETPKINGLLLDAGDILFNRTNSAELVGKTAVYRSTHPKATFASYLIRVKACDSYLPELVSYYINSFYGRKYIAAVVSQQVGQANVNGTKLANMPIIVPPLDEQVRIVAELERKFSIIEDLETTVRANLTRAERARQAILKRAFEGKLVP